MLKNSDLALENLPHLPRKVIQDVCNIVKTALTLPNGESVITVHSPALHPNGAFNETSDAVRLALSTLIGDADNFLVVGLGNAKLTCDSLGTLTAEQVAPTRLTDASKKLSVLCPGVSGRTGIDTFDTVCAVVERIKPNCILIVDSLAARDPSHIGTTFQLSTDGIAPASGLGLATHSLNRHTLGCNVLSIGVPTVVRAGVLAADIAAPLLQQTTKSDWQNRLKTHPLSHMVVMPKESDCILARCAAVIASAINQLIADTPTQTSSPY